MRNKNIFHIQEKLILNGIFSNKDISNTSLLCKYLHIFLLSPTEDSKQIIYT